MKLVCYVLICFSCVQRIEMTLNELEEFSHHLNQTSILDPEENSEEMMEENEEQPISDSAWETSGQFEGDIILNDFQRRMILSNIAEGLARTGTTDLSQRWPNNELIYLIKRKHFTVDQIQIIQDAIDTMANVSCVKFKPHMQGDNNVLVIKGNQPRCRSQIGYQGGRQYLNLNARHPAGHGCLQKGTILHELLHVLGFFHMHSSPDRDNFVTVVWNNINNTAKHNFWKYNTTQATNFGVDYDYMSIMHYSNNAFSINGGDTIIAQNGTAIGQRNNLSQKDILKLNKMYNCPVAFSLTTTLPTTS